jgi:hypothetical protein
LLISLFIFIAHQIILGAIPIADRPVPPAVHGTDQDALLDTSFVCRAPIFWTPSAYQ